MTGDGDAGPMSAAGYWVVQRRELQQAASSRNESRSFFSYNEADTGNYLSDFQLRVCSFTAEFEN